MATKSLRELAKKNRADVESAEEELRKDKELAEKQSQYDDSPIHDGEAVVEESEEYSVEVGPEDRDDTEHKFERLSKKVSGLEKSNHEKERALAEAQERIKQLESPPKPKLTAEEQEAALIEELRSEVGPDSWDYFDDAQRKAFIAMAKRNQKPEEDEVQSKIDAVLSKRDKEALTSRFVKSVDDKLLDSKVSLAQLVNDKKFNSWLTEKRRRVAVFEDAVQNKDDEAVGDIIHLYGQYKESGKSKPGNATPTVKSKGKAPNVKPNSLTAEDYEKAIRMKVNPKKRAEAQRIIDAYRKQLEES